VDAPADEPRDLATLYRRYGPLVLRRGRRFLGSQAAAEELVHEVFLRALESPDLFRDERSPVRWLYRVATNLCLNRLRDDRRRASLLSEHGPTVWAQREAESPEARAFLDKLWRTLEPELAEIGVLYWVDGLTTAEIGRMHEVSDRTIANRLERITRLARQAAGEEAP
jgi:RNA polymerase sigma-70 factor (ECF subfamily)